MGQATLASKSMLTTAPPSDINGANPADSAFNENALVWNAVRALSHGVSRNAPPSASSGANAMAWRNPSRRPQRDLHALVRQGDPSGLRAPQLLRPKEHRLELSVRVQRIVVEHEQLADLRDQPELDGVRDARMSPSHAVRVLVLRVLRVVEQHV